MPRSFPRFTRPSHTIASFAATTFTAVLALPASAQWVPDHQHYTITRLGLFSSEHTGSAGLQTSAPRTSTYGPILMGTSNRYTGVNTDNGLDTWTWNGTSLQQVGLTGGEYTTSSGYQYSNLIAQAPQSAVAGYSRRFTSAGVANGQNTWVWQGASTQQIGLTGGVYAGSTGYQFSAPITGTHSGPLVIAGHSHRITGINTSNGQDAWAWNGATSQQIGLFGGIYTGNNGLQTSIIWAASGSAILGNSMSYSGSTSVGSTAWIWNGASTKVIGLTDSWHTNGVGGHSAQIRQSYNDRVVGRSSRFNPSGVSSGESAWYYDGTSTVQIGLSSPGHTSATGYHWSEPVAMNANGQVLGFSNHEPNIHSHTSREAWVFNGSSTIRIGLTGGDYIATNGVRYAFSTNLNDTGQATGYSTRYSPIGGRDAWVWDGSSTTQIGLTGGVYRGSTGFQISEPTFQHSQSSHVIGYSLRVAGVSGDLGRDAWVWDGTITRQIGLTGGVYTTAAGFQRSSPARSNATGQVVGGSARYSAAGTQIGQDIWYFDPATNLTTAIIGSVRTSDNYAYSIITLLTEEGTLMGQYEYFDGGLGDAQNRAFAFRPDLGFTDLGALVEGGLSASGWSTLQRPHLSDLLDAIVGTGLVEGQNGGQSVFLMTIPAPGAAGLLGAGALAAVRRRRSSVA